MRKKDREKVGFACELGLYQWKRIPFGLCNATATFQRLMAQALTGVTKKYGNLLMCYVDDVVIATPTLEDHIDRLDEVFGCMKRAGLKCKPSKCEILRDSIKYLGRMVDRHGVRPDPEAVEAVLTWKAPRTDTQLMSFLGFANYYREFIKGYADKVYPMQKLMRNQWKRMPFGLCNATATFQRLMAQALTGVTKKYGNLLMCYVDDVVIATPTLEDHIDRLDEVFGCMKRAGLKCKPSKCEILRDSIKYLGRMVDRHGVRLLNVDYI